MLRKKLQVTYSFISGGRYESSSLNDIKYVSRFSVKSYSPIEGILDRTSAVVL